MKTRTFSSAGIRNLTTGLVLFFVAILPMAVSAQLTGTKTVGAGGDYATIELAIADLNLAGVGPGGVTFNVAAGHTETLSSATAGTITATGTMANPIVFQKSGAGANPVITAFAWTAATAYDGMIKIAGGDYITFDAIDLQENVLNTTNRTDWGYALVKGSATAPFNGCQYVTIKNCNITLNKANTTAIGIYAGNHIATATTSLTLTATGDAMSNCSFLNNTISNVYIGISLNGFSTAAYYDLNNSITGNQISNYGGAASTSYGIYTIYNGELIVSNNTIVSGTGTTTTLYGIFCSTATSKNITISGNNVTVTGGGTTTALYGISNSVGSTAAGNTVNMSGNTVSNCTYPTATTGLFHAIVNSATAATVNIFNNNVTNNILPGTGAFIGIYNSGALGTGPLNIYGNTISNNSKTGTSGTLYGCQATTATVNFYQNIISFNSITGGSSALYGYYNVGSPVTETYHSNQIFNLNHGGTGTTVGIQISTAAGTKNVYNNQIYNISSGGAANGYSSAYGAPLNFYNNRIYNITTTGAATVATGITYSGTTGNIYNNYISGINPTMSNSANGAIGINITGGTTQNIYYNTVFLNATSTSTTTFGSSGVYASSTPTTTLANNIIVNTSLPGPTGGNTVAFRYSTTAYTTLSANTNNNCFYADAPGPYNLIFFDGTNSDQTIGDYKMRMSPRESASISEFPPFINANTAPFDLHLSTIIPTQCESGGKVITGITNDFDGDPRGTSPDIGADEGTFMLLDLTPPSISFTPFLSTAQITARTLTTTITDATGVPTTGTGLPKLYWNLNAGAYNAVTGVFVTGNTYTFTFGGGVTVGDVINYYIVAQDVAPAANVGSNPFAGAGGFTTNPPAAGTPPTTPYTYTILPSISGTYNVGVGAGMDYPTITAAAADLNIKEMTGPVTFLLHDATYPSETFPITFNANGGSSSTNTFTLKPAPGITTLITGSSASSIFKLNGIDYMIFDGSNNGTNSRDITVINTATTANSAAFWVASAGNGMGSVNNTIKNCIIQTGSNTATTYAIASGGATVGAAGSDNDNLTIQNNVISKAYYAIYVGGNVGGEHSGVLIKDNIIGSSVSTDYVLFYGIYAVQMNNSVISGNEIFNMYQNGAKYGIFLTTGSSFNMISANTIHDFNDLSGNTSISYSIAINCETGLTDNTIMNNLIYNVFHRYTTTNAYQLAGIRIIGGTNYKLYNNTVSMTGTASRPTAGTYAHCLMIYSAATTNMDLRNNIFYNAVVNPGYTMNNYTVYTTATSTFTNIDNNSYFTVGANLGYWNGANKATFADWKASSGQDLNSLNLNPVFKSATNFEPTAIEFNSAGAIIPVVTTDIFGVLRSTPPDIGAIEFTPPLNDAGVLAITSPAGNAPLGSSPILVTLKNYGMNPLTAVTINYQVNGGTVYSFPWTGNILTGATLTNVNIGSFNFSAYNTIVKAWTSMPNGLADEDNTNDTSQTSFYVCNPLAGVYTLGGVGADFPTFANAFDQLNNCGIGGPVVFNVPAGYTEAITLAASPNNFGLKLNATGTAVNTITFQKSGAGVNPLITFTGTTATNDAGIWLNGSDYVTFDGIDLYDGGSTSTDYLEWGLHLQGTAIDGCSYNTFKNGVVDLNRNNTASRCIRLNGASATSAAGSNDYNKFYNNTLLDAAQGYYLLGTSTYKNIGNEIGNELSGVSTINGMGFLATTASVIGVYANYQDGLKVFNTTIDSLNGSYGTYPTTVGIYVINSNNTQISGNTIRRITTAAGDPVGINFESATGTSNAIFNNTLKEISATVSGNINSMRLYTGTGITLNVYGNQIFGLTNAGSGTSNGIYCSYTNSNINVYNNKLSDFYNSGATANIIYGIYLSGTGNTYNVYNNMVYDFRAPASTGTAPAVSGIRAENSICKIYHNTVLLNYTSTAASNTSTAMYANASANLTMNNNVFVNKTDVTTGTRAAAFWYSSATYTNIQTATNNNLLYAGAAPAANTPIFFNGTTAFATLVDYQTAMATRDQAAMTEDVPFVNPVVTPYDVHVQQFVPTLVESQGLKQAIVTTDIDDQLRFGEPGYVGTGVAVDLGADEITGIAIFTCTTPAPGNTVSSATSICLGQSVNLSLQNATSGTGVTYQWKESTDGNIYTNIPGANAATAVVTPAQAMWYYCEVKCFNGPVMTASVPVAINFATTITGTTPGTRCGLGTVTLGATASAGTIYWHANPIGGAPIGTGNTLITPVINATTTFYASAANAAPASVVLGAGGTASSTAGQTFFPGAWGGTKTQYIIKASELIAAGLSAGPITSLGFTPTTSGQTYQGFYVNIGHTNDATAPTTTFIATGFTQVYAGTGTDDAYTPVAGTLNTLTFGTGTGSSPVFVWDGVSNLVVSISWSLVPAATTSTGSTMLVDNVGFTASAYRQRDSYTPAAMLAETSVNSTTTYRPQFTINGIAVCSGPRVPVVATVTPAPAITAVAGSNNICLGQSTTLSVTSPNDPNYTYTWNPGQLIGATQIVTPAANTTYTVMAVDNSGQANNGCVNTADVAIAVHPIPSAVVVTPPAATVCNGQIVQLNATGGSIGGQPTPTGTGTVQNTSSSYPTPYGAYYETVRQQYLVLASELVAAGIQPGASLSSVTFDVAALNGSGVHIDFKIRLAHTTATSLAVPLISPVLQLVYGPVSYQPLLGSNLHTFSTPFTWDGTSNLLVDICFANDPLGTGGTMYTNNASVNATNTAFNSAAWVYADNLEYCSELTGVSSGAGTARANMLFGATGVTNREWTPQAGLYTDAAATLPYTGGAAVTIYAKPGTGTQTYTYTSTSLQNCSSSGSSTITVNPLPTATTTLAATEYICPGGSKTLTVDLTGTPPWTITVGDGSGTMVVPGILTTPWTYPVSPTVATTYTVTSVTDANCTNTANLSVTVDFHPVPAPLITGGSPPAICPTGSTTLNAGSGFTTYLWSDNSTGQTLQVLGSSIGSNASANYSVTVTNQFGCVGSNTVAVSTYPALTANAGPDVAICPGLSTQLNASGIGGAGGNAYGFVWSPAAGLSNLNSSDPIASPLNSTTYTVTVTDLNNCTATDDVVVAVYPAVVVDFTGLNTDYCIDAPVATLTGSPLGGTFSGPGITGNTFNPALAGVGGPYTITYTYTDGNNCIWTITRSVIVNALPVVSFSGLNAAYCVDAGTASLTGNPAGGNFSGPGIAGSTFVTFNPATAGVGGPYTITYTYTDGNGCVNNSTGSVTVYALPVVSFSGLNAAYCVDALAATLNGSPSGGTFSGLGVIGNSFDPSVAGAGTHLVTYTYTDGNFCTNSSSQSTTVNPLPVLSVTPIASGYCIDNGPVNLSGTPAGGVWSGPGVVGSQFVPSIAGAGNHTLMFSYTDVNQCYNSTTVSTNVWSLPLVTFATPADICVNAVPVALTGGLPINGTYSGPGVLAGNFDPSVAGTGSHTLTYTFTDANNCTNSATASILVNALTPLSFPVLAGVCVDAALIPLNTATPAGGTYSGPGVSNNIFTPATAGVGIHTLTYTYTDGNSCTNSITQTIEVFALPVLTMSPAAVICEGASTNISVTAAGAGGYSYLWDNVASLSDPAIANPVATPGVTTTYTVAVTDMNLCVQTGSVVVTVNPLPVFTMNPAAVDLCLGGSAQIGVDGNLAGYSFLWNNASTLNNPTISWPMANPTVTTTYTVTVTNIATSCQKTGSMVVTVLPNPAPVINGVNANYCKDAPAVVLAGTPAGGQFFIDNVAVTALDPSTLAVGGHQVTYWVTHPNNCQNNATLTFTVRQLPVANAGADQNTCAGLPVFLNATATGGTSPYGWAWSPATGLSNAAINNPVATTLADITYSVTVTDQYGCQGADNVTIFATAIPVANAGSDVTICYGQTTQLQASGGNTYSWSPSAGLSNPNIDNPVASPAVTTTYTVTASSVCGVATDDVVITVNQLPVLSIVGLPANVCIDAAPLTLAGVPTGGTFTGTGIAGNVFNPATAGVGGPYNITYAYTDGNNCSNTYTQAVNVRPLPVVNFTGLNASYCLNMAPATLTGTPAGGTFSGPGISGNIFSQMSAGLGTHNITYTYTDGFGCVNYITKQTTIAQPVATLTGLNPVYCVNSLPVNLTGLPAGGIFTGAGMNGSLFVPSVAGVGNHTITYTFTDQFGCVGTTSANTAVNPLTAVSFTGLAATYCSNDPVVTLTGVPAGGTFSGPGITGNTFNPATAGNGTRTIYYTISGAGFCTNTTTQTTVVSPQPNASFTNLDPKYCISAAPATLIGAPTGGVFTGNGITGNVFSPLAAGAGTHAITYTVTTLAGCSNSMTKTTVVNPLPVLTITGLAGPYCTNAPVVALTGTPAGGTFQGPGIVGTSFNPALAGVGTHVITYTYQDANNCVNSISQNVTVNAVPVVTLTPLAPVCEGAGAITLSGGLPVGGVYSGNGVFGNAFYPLLSGTGTHAVTYTYVTPGTGCTGTATVNQVVNVKPVVNAGSDTTILYNTKANLLGTATGGTGSYTYSWTPAAQVLLPNAYGSLTTNLTATTIFTFAATDAFTGCSSSDQKIVNVTGSALNVAATTNLPALCIGNSAILTAMPTGGSLNYTTINWTSVPAGSYPHTLSITVTPLVTTTYTVTIFDGYNYASANVTVTVNPLPTVTVNPVPANVCLNAAPVALSGTPAGGAFTGNGVVANTFYPNIAGIGTHTLTYTYTNANGCTNTATASIKVNSMPSVNIGFIPANVCINAAPLTLTGTPAGGTFSGPGVTGNTFNPATAGLGMNTITYTYSDANGCSGTFSKTVNVLPLPVVSIVGLASNFCVNGATVTLTGSPAGGAFSGPGTGLSTFSPVVAGTGVKTITYTYTNSSGCTNTTSQNVTVNPQPTLAFVGLLNQYCVNASPVTLSATPAGGIFTGTGVTGNTFSPALAGVGTKTITYSYTAPTGCSNTITATVNVRPISTLSIIAPATACINGTSFLLKGSPTGGTFSGPGVTGSNFNPVTAGLGAKTITYTYSNSFSCVSSTTHTITVVSPATGSIAGLASSYCIPSNQVVTLVGTPAGGTFSGPGMSNNLFKPQTAGTGAKTITYSFVDANGCANTTTANTTVNTTVATITGLASSYCLNSAPVTMVGNTAGGAGGVFTGNGVVGNVFNPSFAGVGGHTITYTLTNPTTGCTGVATKYVVVHSIPNVAIVNLAASQCVNGPVVTINTSPATGGTLSGPGVNGTAKTFNPATAGVGTHTISFSWTNANNCTVTATQQVTVHGLPSVSFTGLAGPYCQKDPAVTLTGNPVGGYFTGPGVGSGTFYPLTATPGTHTVTYTYTHPVTGCTNTATQQAVVYANPVINLPNDTTICVNHVITLDAGAGGTSYQWSTGATTQTATINAATLGTGYHQIFVTVTNANNCSTSKMIKVIISACEGIDDPDGITTVEAYPNPTDGVFNLTFHNVEGTFDMTIQNELGQIIGSEKVTVEDNVYYRKSINLSTQPAGVYFIRLANDQSTKVIRVVIQR